MTYIQIQAVLCHQLSLHHTQDHTHQGDYNDYCQIFCLHISVHLIFNVPDILIL